MSIKETVKSLCDEAGITINKLEQETGIGRGSVARWDDHEPSISKVQAVADYFHVSVDSIVGQKKYPADFSEVDKALFDESSARRNDPRLRIMFHKMEKATDEQIDKINAMIDIFMGESQS